MTNTQPPSTEPFTDTVLPVAHNAVAPDGSLVRLLVRLSSASLAHFELRIGEVSIAQRHRRVSELWYVLSGQGQMWRKQDGRRSKTIDLREGTAFTIPVRTSFQFRNSGRSPLSAVGVTIPPWPVAGEGFEVAGPWQSHLY
jgi:mannose-6-phosphate isomerase-like protein (cupin superfamily)